MTKQYEGKVNKAAGTCKICGHVNRYDAHGRIVCEFCSNVEFEPSYFRYVIIEEVRGRKKKIPAGTVLPELYAADIIKPLDIKVLWETQGIKGIRLI